MLWGWEGPGCVAMQVGGQLAKAKDTHRVRPDMDGWVEGSTLDSSPGSAWPWPMALLSLSL